MVYYQNGYRPFPRYYGLGAAETEELRKLPPRLAAIVADSLDEPETLKLVSKLLKGPNPTQALARVVAQVISESSFEDPEDPDYYFEEVLETPPKSVRLLEEMRERGLGSPGIFKSFKRVAKKIGKPFAKLARKHRDLHRKIKKKYIRPNLPIILGVAGAVLAPFTGGLSSVAASAIIAGRKYREEKKAAKKAKELGKAEAAEMAAEVAEMERELNEQADELYEEATEHFLAAGYTRARWDALSAQEKMGIIERIADGTMPATPLAAAQASREQGQAPPPSPTHTRAAPPPAHVRPPPPPPPRPGLPPPPPRIRAPLPPTPEELEAPAGTYELYVEGRKVGDADNIQDISVLVGRKASPGDRFEVFFNGKSTGLKIRTPNGAISVPREEAIKVRALPPEAVKKMVIRAAASAHEKAKPGIPWWLVVGGAGAAIFVSAA